MGGKIVRNILLGLAACLCMVALGWVAAKVAGPPAAGSASQTAQTSSRGFLDRLFDRSKRFDLSGLKAWEGRPPHDAINGQTLFDHPGFKAALRETLGEKLFLFFDREQMISEGFFFTELERDGQILRMGVKDHMLDKPLDAIIFINADEGFLDVFWSEEAVGEDGRSEMLLHTGERFPVDSWHATEGLKYEHLNSAGNYAAFLKDQQEKFLGVWSGTHARQIGRSRVHVTRTITVTGDPSKLEGLRYKQEEVKQTSRGVFTCNKSSTLTQIFEGVVSVGGDSVAVFSPKTITEPQCGGNPMLMYRYDNGVLVREGAPYTGVYQGGLCEPLRKVE